MAQRIESKSQAGYFEGIRKEKTELTLFFEREIATLDGILASKESFAPFRLMTRPLKLFLHFEKARLNRVEESRYAVDESHEILTGFVHKYTVLESPYDASSMETFNLGALWIPVDEGSIYVKDYSLHQKITKEVEGKERILFLIHPQSKKIYAPLLEKYQQTYHEYTAIALSSARSLLVALPTIHGFEYLVGKISYDAILGGANRHLTEKECYISIENAHLVESLDIDIIGEQLSFVPSRALVEGEKAIKEGAGMIYRALPDAYFKEETTRYTFPLFSILGENNKDLFKALVKASGLNVEDFIVQQLLTPIAKAMAHQLFNKKTSLEIHGQNLLLSLRKEPPHFPLSFLYRDLGGVSRKDSAKDHLPDFFPKKPLGWKENHTEDAAKVLEGFVHRVIFNLTKMIFNDDQLSSDTTSFKAWKQEMIERNLQMNWQVISDDGSHLSHIQVTSYVRYGFFEKAFGAIFINEILPYLSLDKQKEAIAFYEKLQPKEAYFSSCLETRWFFDLISLFYI